MRWAESFLLLQHSRRSKDGEEQEESGEKEQVTVR
jgi:hypothetical protein